MVTFVLFEWCKSPRSYFARSPWPRRLFKTTACVRGVARGRTEEELIRGVVDQRPSTGGEPLGLTSRPQKNMRVEQQFHAPPPKSSSISSWPIRSKSSGTEMYPAIKPSRRTSVPMGVLRGITFTMGFPALAITNDSPRLAKTWPRLSPHVRLSCRSVCRLRQHTVLDSALHCWCARGRLRVGCWSLLPHSAKYRSPGVAHGDLER